jgi:hypothetical protein
VVPLKAPVGGSKNKLSNDRHLFGMLGEKFMEMRWQKVEKYAKERSVASAVA